MSTRALLWLAFAVVHVGVAVLGFVMPNQPMGDVYLVYEPWSSCALWGGTSSYCPDGREVMGVTAPWVYPQLALVPMLAGWLFAGPGGYTVGWAVVVTIADAVAFALLVGGGRSRGRVAGAWFWLAFIALLGPVGMYRLDGLTVALAVMGCLWLSGRPLLAAVLLSVGTWIKVWPAALLAAAVIALRARMRVVAGAVAVSAVTAAAVLAAGGGAYLFGFVRGQTERGLQIEAPVSTVHMWLTALGVPGSQLYYDRDMLTFQVTGPGVEGLSAAMTPLMAAVMLAVACIGVVKVRRGAHVVALLPPLALSLVMTFVVVNKVGSPQFATWMVAPLVLGLVLDRRRWWRPAVLALVIALLTQLIYPVLYGGVLAAAPWPVTVLTLRNLLSVVLWVWAFVRIARVPVPAGAPRRAASARFVSI
ncbi:hypothetical protein [Microbacterium sp. zg.Y909]|uniref:hypothetical protein n=1 Tax=Microbacterium sp. zg.Y909 TaxID=2969413 RepID=UPI00214B92A6|nr:hypothetical protein [Microbacterium sp. zg.Y909]MCR2825456.1 hypothetical protein [Microbacterium sp. zg.Y909]